MEAEAATQKSQNGTFYSQISECAIHTMLRAEPIFYVLFSFVVITSVVLNETQTNALRATCVIGATLLVRLTYDMAAKHFIAHCMTVYCHKRRNCFNRGERNSCYWP